MKKRTDSILNIVIVIAVIVAAVLGHINVKQSKINVVDSLTGMSDLFSPVELDLYSAETDIGSLYAAISSYPSYNGSLNVGIVADSSGSIATVSIISSYDTPSYLESVIKHKMLDKYLGQNVQTLADVDGLSGATLTSKAIINGIADSASHINAKYFGGTVTTRKAPLPFGVQEILLITIFAVALFVSSRRKLAQNKWLRLGILAFTIITTGFYYGSLFSLSTVTHIISGNWLAGVATLAALLAFVLAIATLIITKKNIYCTYVCPFGAVQECIGTLMSNSAPKTSPWAKRLAKVIMAFFLVVSLLNMEPSMAEYEPFSFFFKFIGSQFVFIISIVTILASLVYRRPWCNLLCPITPLMNIVRTMTTRKIKVGEDA